MRSSRAAVVVLAPALALFACGRDATTTLRADPCPSCSCAPAAAPEKTALMKIDLPTAGDPLPPQEGSAVPERTVLVEIDGKGAVSVDGVPAPDDSALHALVHKNAPPDTRGVLRADRSVSYGQVIHVLDVMRVEGVAKIAFAVSLAAPSPTP